MLFGPGDGVGIGPLAGEKEGAEAGQVVVLQELGVRVLLLDGAEGRRRGEEGRDAVLGDHAPERAGVRGADRLALVHDRRAAVQQRRVDDVGVADDPADVGGGPIDLARLDAVKVFHGPFERDHVAAVVAHHALRHAGRARGVEHVKRVGGGDRHALRRPAVRPRGGDGLGPLLVAAGRHRGVGLRPLQDEAALRLVTRDLDRLVEQRLVGDDAVRLQAAGGGENRLRGGVVDAGRQFLGGEAAEHDRVYRANAGAGQHADGGLGDHRHVENDPVAFFDARSLAGRRPERRTSSSSSA